MQSVSYPIRKSHVFTGVVLALSLILLPIYVLADFSAESVKNRIVSVVQDEEGILISTERPLDDQYTVYDALDPLRIIVDFSEMGTTGLDSEVDVSTGAVEKIKTSSFELSSGQLGRIEVLLRKPMKFEVVRAEKGLRILLNDAMAPDAMIAPSVQGATVEAYSSVTPAKANTPAKILGSVQVDRGKVVLFADGQIGKVKNFTLGDPARLVVDVYGVVAGFKDKVLQLDSGFNKMRVGTYSDKLRFVFDATNSQLPVYSINKEGNTLAVVWGSKPVTPTPAAAVAAPAVVSKKVVAGDVAITDVDFSVNNDKSILAVGLSGAADIVEPVVRGNILQFGIKRASISRQHRRTIDPSVFPSSVRLITPYTVRKNGVSEVRFAVEMKSVQNYQLLREKNALSLVIDNGPYTEPLRGGVERKVVPVEASHASQLSKTPAAFQIDSPSNNSASPKPLEMDSDTISIQRNKEYVGKKISLVFDDADIRNILQLIGEVSDLNIIVGDEVKGTVTLRLIDVPWDQALDLVLEIRELGKLQEGNVLRILPLAKIRQMQQEQFAAARAKEKLEDLVTDLVPVNYTDVDSLVESCEKRLSDRGKVIGDVRDKKLIITDIPSVVEDIKQLVRLLDTPVRQVLIEARIVEASATFSRDLGVNWGLSYQNNPGSDADGNDASIGMGGTLIGIPVSPGEVSSGIVSGLTFGQVGVDKAVLDLRLAALEQSGHGRIISTPRVSTLNGQEAEVAQGTEIPYLSTSEEGTKTEFKKAELSLKVTPEINPDGSVILEIEAKNDSRGANTGLAEAPAIDTKRATTKVLVKDGETTVIGGIFIQDRSESESGVPWLMNVPVLGYLFKSRSVSEERRELLVFITPRILD